MLLSVLSTSVFCNNSDHFFFIFFDNCHGQSVDGVWSWLQCYVRESKETKKKTKTTFGKPLILLQVTSLHTKYPFTNTLSQLLDSLDETNLFCLSDKWNSTSVTYGRIVWVENCSTFNGFRSIICIHGQSIIPSGVKKVCPPPLLLSLFLENACFEQAVLNLVCRWRHIHTWTCPLSLVKVCHTHRN